MFDFKKEINLYKLIWIFIIGSVLGCIVETLWCFIKNGYFQNRQGLLYSPFIPVYGIGCVLCTILLYKFAHKRDSLIFLISAVFGGIFEYICSCTQQQMTGTISWNYTHAVRHEVARIHHIPATNSVAYFLDKHYPNSYLEKIFPNMIFPNA